MTWPALIFSDDLLPNSSALNGRRWASQALLHLWLQASEKEGIDLLSAHPNQLDSIKSILKEKNINSNVRWCSITDPQSVVANGALFIPDPSIGMWASWRQAIGDHCFSLIGQIHTLSTSTAIAMIDAIVSEPVQEWDALICSSTAGKSVVEALLDDRSENFKRRFGATRFPKPQLPVIPLPLADHSFNVVDNSRLQARKRLGLPADAPVVLWLGRRSLLI